MGQPAATCVEDPPKKSSSPSILHCPIEGRAWKARRFLEGQHRPRHLVALSAIAGFMSKGGIIELNCSADHAAKIIIEEFDFWDPYSATHEFDTLVKRNIAIPNGNIYYRFTLKEVMGHLEPYLEPLPASQ